MNALTFNITAQKVGPRTIGHLPHDISAQLPSRGQIMVHGTINEHEFQSPLEPDGRGGHWLGIDMNGVNPGDELDIVITPTKHWPEPHIPEDVRAALSANTAAQLLWVHITPMARWEWLRWINATANTATRERRINVSCSKLQKGERRPCCFNRAACCVPEVSKGGVLLDAS